MFPPTTLAIDFGTKRIGLAISRASLAEPLKVVTYPEEEWLQAIGQILEVCKEEEVKQIVVGMSERDMAELTAEFVALLKTKTALPIELTDETLSSRTVQAKLRQGGHSPTARRGPIDHFAAAEFLQEWLDMQP